MLLLLCCRLSDCSLKEGLFILTASLKQEISGELFILITSKVGLGGFALRESKRCKAVNGVHFFLSHSDLTGSTCASCSTCSTCTSTGYLWDSAVGVSTKNEIHKLTRVLLDQGKKLRLSLSKLLHKLVVEIRILKNALSNQSKVGVGCKGCKWVTACTTTNGGILALIAILIAVVSFSATANTSGSSIEHLTSKRHTGSEYFICDIRDALCSSESKYAIILVSACNHHQIVGSCFQLRSQSTTCSSWLDLSWLRLSWLSLSWLRHWL